MMASTSDSPTHVRDFQANDLIWAKMKGFPPWPAKVLNSNSEPSTSDIPVGRISVMFYGTKETAFMKPSDLFPYLETRHQFEVPRKHKGFNEGVNEIRQSAGLPVDPLFTGESEVIAPPRSPPARTHRSSNNSKLFQDVFLSGFDRNRTKSFNSGGKARSRASSSASLMKTLMQNMKKERSRLNSESSTGSKRRRHAMSESEEQRLVLDAFDTLNPLVDYDPAMLDVDDDNRSKRSRGSSRVFEEYMLSANRLRTRSGSEGGRRSRLISGISGVSDVFDELYDQAQTLFSHDGLMEALDNLPSEGSSGAGGDRARTPEAPLAPLAGTVKFCSDCGCECQPYNKQWRCTSKFCLKLNGPVESDHHSHRDRPSTSNGGSSSMMSSFHHQQPSTSKYMPYPRADHIPRKVVRVQPTSSIDAADAASTSAGPSISRGLIKDESTMRGGVVKEERMDMDDDERLRRQVGGMEMGRGMDVRMSRRDEFNSSVDDPSPGRIKRKTVRISPPPPPVRSPTRRGTARPMKYKVEKTPPVSENGLRNCAFCGGAVRPQMCGGNKHSTYRWRCVDKKCRKWYGWVKTSDEIPRDMNKKALGASPDKSSGPGSVDNSPLPEKKRLGRPPKHQGLKIRLGTTKKELEAARPKRKYTKRKDREAAAAAEGVMLGPDGKKLPKAARALSPLTQREAAFRPSTLQRRSRWWTAEKRRNDYSPPRDISGETPMDAVASFRLISQAMRACSVTAANSVGEPGTVAGAMDILMDTLCASMAPLVSLLNQFPRFAPTEEINTSLWNSSLVHTPIFQ
ncbi:hypothetical protein PRIPAC_84203 [Pristionchus pacificus]|nr:hypothetical protein PRIPAC_84203 [Pristionchus pacificus]